MKSDILTLCILATLILGISTRHVSGFQASQTSADDSHASAGELARLSPDYNQLGSIFGGGGLVGDESAGIQPRGRMSAKERNVYDPGDVLLNALNAELGQELSLSPEETEYANAAGNELEVANKFDMLKKMEQDLRAEQELVDKSALLMKLLEDPTLDTLPLVYVEEEEQPGASGTTSTDDYPELENSLQSLVLGQTKSKRSRYYRRYPWKRHNRNRGNYEPEMRYACTPSKEDIFKLLVNLHENRKGNHSKTVNFCNRKRPAKVVFTNIRFLG